MTRKIISLNIFYYFFMFFGISIPVQKSAFAQINYSTSNNSNYEFINKYKIFYNESENKNTLENVCEKQLKILSEHFKENKLWALKFMDAWAKIPAGILYGHNTEMGNFDECLSLNERVFDDMQIKGKYCLTQILLRNSLDEDLKPSDGVLNLNFGICIPNVCSASDAEQLLKIYFEEQFEKIGENSTMFIDEQKCTQNDREPFNTLDWIAVAILICLSSLMILSTSYDYFCTNNGKMLSSLLVAFSVRSNMRQLMQMTTTAETPKHIIPALNGIRSLSIIWIIFLHSFMMLILSPNINNYKVDVWSQTPFYMIWKNANYAVDTFFCLSGMLLISVAFREMEKKSGKLNIPLMYLHRYIRLSPVLYLAVLLFMTLFRFAGNGPIWNGFISSYHLCEDTWWATLLYVQNYAAAGKMCLGHSWYLAVDTQLYFLSPIALLLIWKWRRWGLAILLFIGLLLAACLFSIIIIDNLIVFNTHSDPSGDSTEMRLTYYSTHTRASPWIIGIIFGYFMHINSGRRVNISKFIVFGGWFISLAMFFVVIFALYAKTRPESNLIEPLEGAFYLTLSRIAWPLGLCWLIFACVNGYAGPINTFLSCKIWQPISRLSYCMYIWHMLVVMVNAGQIKTNSHFSNYDAILRFWSDFGITILLSAFMYLAIEAPMLGIEKFLLAKKPQKVGFDKTTTTTISQQNLCD